MKRSTKLAIAGIVLLGAAAAWWVWGRPPIGFLTGMHPIDGRRAVFTMRHNRDDGLSQAWIGVVDAEGVVWSHQLPDLTYSTYARHGLTVSGDRATVKVTDTDSYAQVLAFDVQTGDPLWHSARIDFGPSEYAMIPHVVTGTRPFDDGRQLLHGDHDRLVARLVARDPDDGSTQWSLDLPGDGVQQSLISTSVAAYRDDAGWVLVRRSDGSIARRIDVFSAACIDGERFVTWGEQALVEVDLASDELAPTERPLPSPGIPISCGVHGGEVVFGVRVSGEDRNELVGIDRSTPDVAWRIDLGPWEPSVVARSRDNRGPEADPLEGTLSDFVPVLLSADDTDGLKVAVLDLRRHAIAWESPQHESLLHYQVFRGSGDQHFLSDGRRLMAIDGATGEPTAAAELPHEQPRAFHAVDGRLWVYSMEYTRMTDLPWLLLDGRTLEVVARGGDDLAPADVSAELGARLRPPA